MDNQHRVITGYRELTQSEIDLMNEIKAKGKELEELVGKVVVHVSSQTNAADQAENKEEAYRIDAAEPQRWAYMARTDFQVALMKLTRAVAQPTSF